MMKREADAQPAAKPKQHITDQELRTPKAAAIAGIIFAVLFSASYVLMLQTAPALSQDTGRWILRDGQTAGLALGLLPFAGIAFLWFMAVVRDRLGHLEDQFFSTLFYGSGLLYLAMTFTAAAIFAGIISMIQHDPELLESSGLYLATRTFVEKITTSYIIRMAGMFMFVLGTIWLRTRLMPKWLVVTSYLLALVLLFSSAYSQWIMLVFPAWVLLVSICILVLVYRDSDDTSGNDGMTPRE